MTIVLIAVGATILTAAAVSSSATRSAPVIVSPSGFATEPVVGLDRAGDQVAVWNQQVPTSGSDLVVATRAHGSAGWSTLFSLYTLSVGTTFDPQLAVAPSGAAVVAWQAEGARAPKIDAVYRTSAAAPWSTPTIISGVLDGPQQLATDDQGHATLVYDDGIEGSSEAVDAMTLDTRTGAWSTPVKLGPGTDGLPDPQVAVDPRGDAVAVWSTNRKPPSGSPSQGGDRFDSWVLAAVKPASSGWRPAARLGAETQFAFDVDFEAGPTGPQIALDSRGDSIAVWQSPTSGDQETATGATLPRGAHRWRAIAPLDVGESFSPRVVSSAGGWATIAWETETPGIATRSGSISGHSWSPAMTFAGSVKSMDYHLQLVAGPGHGAALGFSRSAGAVALAIHPRGGKRWGKAVAIGLGPGQGRSTPDLGSLAVDADGQLLAAWTQMSRASTKGYEDSVLYARGAAIPAR